MEGWERQKDCGVCRGVIAGAECKRKLEDDDPRLTPEQLCVLGLVEAIDRNRENNYTRSMAHAWNCLELSLASAASYRSFARQQIDEAFETLDTIICEPNNTGNIAELCEAVALKNFEGIFRARALLQPITPELMKSTRDNIGALICTIDETEDVPPPYAGYISGFMAEQIVSWLMLYSADPSNTIYPTSYREGHSDRSTLNHDYYLLRHADKIPVEVKRRHRRHKKHNKRRYEKPIIKVVLQDILEQTASVHGGVTTRRENFLIDLIKFDLSGRASPAKARVLHTASEKLLTTIERSLSQD